MEKSKLQKKLKSDPRFIPYNEKYDFDYILEYLKETIDSDESSDLKHNALNSSFFNPYYKDLKHYYQEIIDRNTLSKETFLELLITFANRDLYLLTERTRKSFDNKSEFHYDEMMNSSFKSNIPELGEINVQAGLEASHDGLNLVMNMVFQNYKEENNDSHYKLNQLDDCAKLLGFSNIYIVIKSGYDIAIWENYAIRYSKDNKELKIKVLEKKNQFLNRVGEFRLERNIFSSKILILSSFQEKNSFYKYISFEANKKRKAKRLKNVMVIDNELKYKLADGFEKESVLKELQSFSSLTTYYGFIRNEKLPNLDNVNLYDILLVFTEVQHLFSNAQEIKKVESATEVQFFDTYKIKIKKQELTNYIVAKTKYSLVQVKQIIELFCHKEGFSNIWERPIIELERYLIPVMLPLLSPNSLRMLDYWLEKGGFDLDSRGALFEKYIKDELLYTLTRKGFKVNIPTKNIFRNKKDEFEEIDLILELKNITLIAEVKCIKYPFDPRDYSNMHQRLSEGAEQINRKTEFLKNNINDFDDESYLFKPFVKLVITNYPIFSGYIIHGVPVADFSLIENYFINGALGKGVMKTTKKGIGIDDNFHSEIRYYHNENEFCDNLEKFFMNPIPITEKLKDIYIEETQISLPKGNPKIIMDYVKFKQSNTI
jgi:hypothetical protein